MTSPAMCNAKPVRTATMLRVTEYQCIFRCSLGNRGIPACSPILHEAPQARRRPLPGWGCRRDPQTQTASKGSWDLGPSNLVATQDWPYNPLVIGVAVVTSYGDYKSGYVGLGTISSFQSPMSQRMGLVVWLETCRRRSNAFECCLQPRPGYAPTAPGAGSPSHRRWIRDDLAATGSGLRSAFPPHRRTFWQADKGPDLCQLH